MENTKTIIEYDEIIIWYMDDKQVGKSHLPEMTHGGERDWLAYRQGVKEYNNFTFVKNGEIRMDANKTIFEGQPYGVFSGKRYAKRIENNYFI